MTEPNEETRETVGFAPNCENCGRPMMMDELDDDWYCDCEDDYDEEYSDFCRP